MSAHELSALASSRAAILEKYSQEPASLELHVHPTHLRFSTQDGIIPRNNTTTRQLLESLIDGVILPEASEVFCDSGIRFYEGCIILKLIDYTKGKPQEGMEEMKGAPPKPEIKPDPGHETRPQSRVAQQSPSKPQVPLAQTQRSPSDEKRRVEPRSYRILLEPDATTVWADILARSDAARGRFSDQTALNIESEILSRITRKIDLRAVDGSLYHRQVALVNRIRPVPYTHRITHPRRPRKLYEEDVQKKSSVYEDFMLLLDERSQNGGASSSNQFLRLSFIEQLSAKRQRAQELSNQAPAKRLNTNIPNGPQRPGSAQMHQSQMVSRAGSAMPGPEQLNGQFPPLPPQTQTPLNTDRHMQNKAAPPRQQPAGLGMMSEIQQKNPVPPGFNGVPNNMTARQAQMQAHLQAQRRSGQPPTPQQQAAMRMRQEQIQRAQAQQAQQAQAQQAQQQQNIRMMPGMQNVNGYSPGMYGQ